MTTTTFKFNYKPNGRNPEIYRRVKVVGYYGSNDYKNLGMTVIVPDSTGSRPAMASVRAR